MWLAALLLWGAANPLPTAAGPTLIGSTVPLTGPMASSGIRANAGLRLAFWEANDNFVLQHNISLVWRDDKSGGPTALRNVQLMNSSRNPLLFAGLYGDAAFEQVLPFFVQNRIPLVGSMAGLSATRTPFQDVVVNLRPSYRDELVAHGRFLVEHLRLQRIACSFADDAMGIELYAGLVDTLAAVGVRLVAWSSFAANGTTTDLAAAVDGVLRAAQREQAMVLLGQDVQVAQFVVQYQLDLRATPNCTFALLSFSATPDLGDALGAANWPSVVFTRIVPPADGRSRISQRFLSAVAQYQMPADYASSAACFEGYIVGRFLVQVVLTLERQAPSDTNPYKVFKREAFLDRVYGQLIYLDDLLLGLFGSNSSGCADGICSCNSGMRRIFMATLDAAAGVTTRPEWPVTQYAITECSASTDLIRRPLLFAVLIPTDDPVVARIAHDVYAGIKSAFAAINASGGLNGRQYDAVAAEYSGDPAGALAALTDRWPLVALLGGVVAGDTELPASLPRIGTLDLVPRATEPRYIADDLRMQATTPLELLALASYVAGMLDGAVHFRVRRSSSSAALLDTLTKVVNTVQAVPASAAAFDSPTAAFDGLSSGYVIGLGNATDLLAWLDVLEARPALTLLTTLPCVLQLISAQSYGAAAAAVVAKVLSGSPSTCYAAFTTPADVAAAWYDVQTIKSGGLVLGPYYAANCTGTGNPQCQCNLGVHSVAIVSPVAPSNFSYQFQIPTCNVVYKPLRPSAPASSFSSLPVVLGIVLTAVAMLAVMTFITLRSRRNNAAAPKDASQPFCVLFTDIQASTVLWATLPNDMAEALDTHHRLMRRLIHSYQCYEVKTIGDSFMCAAKSPAQALRFALAVQRAFHAEKWATTAIDHVYASLAGAETKERACWNGLRVRVGIHFGHGDIRQDPVTHGYDYYGTVVNTAARIESVCHGGQVVVSEAVRRAVGEEVAGAVWTDLGSQDLRGLLEPVHLYQALPRGFLAQRRFPPLRTGRVANGEDAEDDLQEEGSDIELSSSSDASMADNWAEAHPLVQRGDTTAEDLRRNYGILRTALCTLLASQLTPARQQMVRQLCERMHVVDHGDHGPGLLHTVHGLVKRVLPATVLQRGAARHSSTSSRLSSIPTSTHHATSMLPGSTGRDPPGSPPASLHYVRLGPGSPTKPP